VAEHHTSVRTLVSKGSVEEGLEEMIGLAKSLNMNCVQLPVLSHQRSEAFLIRKFNYGDGQFFEHGKRQPFGIRAASNV
jgi:hypothetical protein